MLIWPDARTVGAAVRDWARRSARERGDAVRVGCFGSSARGDWGAGSDLDLVVVERSDAPFERRAAGWDVTGFPVPADVLVYTRDEWQSLDRRARFSRTLAREAVWVYP